MFMADSKEGGGSCFLLGGIWGAAFQGQGHIVGKGRKCEGSCLMSVLANSTGVVTPGIFSAVLYLQNCSPCLINWYLPSTTSSMSGMLLVLIFALLLSSEDLGESSSMQKMRDLFGKRLPD